MIVDFNFYGNKVSGYIPDSYSWCLPIFEASLELNKGVPSCPKFHCAGLQGLDYKVEIKTPTDLYKMVVSDTGTTFVKA